MKLFILEFDDHGEGVRERDTLVVIITFTAYNINSVVYVKYNYYIHPLLIRPEFN